MISVQVKVIVNVRVPVLLSGYARLSIPTAPVPGSPALMGNRQNEDLIVFGDVKQIVGKFDQDLPSNLPIDLLG
jgi:hypothetical protein